MLHVEWYHVFWPRLTAKRVEPVVSISWASCLQTWCHSCHSINRVKALKKLQKYFHVFTICNAFQPFATLLSVFRPLSSPPSPYFSFRLFSVLNKFKSTEWLTYLQMTRFHFHFNMFGKVNTILPVAIPVWWLTFHVKWGLLLAVGPICTCVPNSPAHPHIPLLMSH